ncbi:hypothetical protein J009_05240 [Cryptococcus neoformans]|nr:hypothetical protein J009_05240 [Cryptococcus neoformans var. grubii]OXH46145.1 hypothetical protein J004_05295 [Cryptococcus neoformans var. grubii]OXH49438.1 hypothetical protein J002_05210 [Cryptococcus neoformans var. grubii]
MTRSIRLFSDVYSPSVIVNPQQAFHSLSISLPHVVTSIFHVNLPTSILVLSSPRLLKIILSQWCIFPACFRCGQGLRET